jgi:PST family polysaccharide transporter
VGRPPKDEQAAADREGGARGEQAEQGDAAEAGHAAGQRRASALLTRAVRGAFWMILSGSGARVLGILGTLAVTRYLVPEEYGEVSLAALIIQIANLLTNAGLSQYLAAKPNAGRDVVFHATVYYMLLGVVGLAVTVFFGDRFAASLHAPGIVKYLPAIAAASILDRIATIQDRIQLRQQRFRSVGVQRSLGELVYSAVSVGLAALAAGTHWGGANAIVWATVARAVLRFITLSATTDRKEWLSPCALRRDTTMELFSFGLPMAIVTIAAFGSQKFDNLVFQLHFGAAWLIYYNLAYNFADMPAALIAEQVGDVLVPSFARMEDDEKRKSALLLSMRMLVLLVAPAAMGLAVVAPTLCKLAFPESYREGIAKILQLLAMFSVARTITWIGNSYLQVRNEGRTIMVLETARMIAIVVFMNLFIIAGWRLQGPQHAVRWACASVVFVFTMSGLSYMFVFRKLDGVSLKDQIFPLVPPILACVPMVMAVVGVRRLIMFLGLFRLDHPALRIADQVRVFAPRLVIEILVGAVVFVPSALIFAPRASRELVGLVRDAIQRRRGAAHDEAEEADAEAAPAAGKP